LKNGETVAMVFKSLFLYLQIACKYQHSFMTDPFNIIFGI